MTRMLFGPIALLAALVSPAVPATEQGPVRTAKFQPSSRATATATVQVRIISGVEFGADRLSGAAGATRRKSELTDSDGLVRPAELLEFQ